MEKKINYPTFIEFIEPQKIEPKRCEKCFCQEGINESNLCFHCQKVPRRQAPKPSFLQVLGESIKTRIKSNFQLSKIKKVETASFPRVLTDETVSDEQATVSANELHLH